MRKNYITAQFASITQAGAGYAVEELQQKLCRFRRISHCKKRSTALAHIDRRMPAISPHPCACQSITRDADLTLTQVVTKGNGETVRVVADWQQ
jgi:hypothetical protein